MDGLKWKGFRSGWPRSVVQDWLDTFWTDLWFLPSAKTSSWKSIWDTGHSGPHPPDIPLPTWCCPSLLTNHSTSIYNSLLQLIKDGTGLFLLMRLFLEMRSVYSFTFILCRAECGMVSTHRLHICSADHRIFVIHLKPFAYCLTRSEPPKVTTVHLICYSPKYIS